ncbi:hypothetical protein OV079_37410 [Nannocystis pusilla]|uniref:Uncharacterized protein n=1 Tax=Nannocystis pusilla TaxID=889268 RepID=A0A9X3J2I7_9BACT|nr:MULTISPECIES: hypothetical protein [Nannocystis]MCY0988308.1 hypothetical protein [Nannocystis sp. ILAH1]MCY1011143.1 hypothetical protein [Nannocystis pusilla]MCY1067731.1 hypothetical protein [Nannocystis sp. RBIL2]
MATSAEPGREVVDVFVARRHVRTGPLHVRPLGDVDDRSGLETRLPLLILLGLGVLVGVQVYLAV